MCDSVPKLPTYHAYSFLNCASDIRDRRLVVNLCNRALVKALQIMPPVSDEIIQRTDGAAFRSF